MCNFDKKKKHEIPDKNEGFRVIPRRFKDYTKSLTFQGFREIPDYTYSQYHI